MKIEREFRYIGFDVDAMTLQGGLLATPEVFKFKRAVFDIPGKSGWLRLRTDGNATTLTVKVASTEKPSESLETELSVGEFCDALAVLRILGYSPRSVQTNYRLLFRIRNCDVSVDFWPEIPPLMEIEGITEEAIEEVESLFEGLRRFRTDKTVSDLYEEHGIDVKYVPDLDFKTIPTTICRLQTDARTGR